MTRSLGLIALLTVAGCGVAPSAENEQGLGWNLCGDDFFAIGSQYEISSSSFDPWGHTTGTVVIYGDSPDLTIYGVDSATANTIDWVMTGGTDDDVDRFESYPQSRRFCGKPTGNVGGGGSPKVPPDPRWNGLCVPDSVWSDAGISYIWGPYDESNDDYCKEYGVGGCIPQSCSALHFGCGSHINNCGQTISCGVCPVPPPPTKCTCGGTYPNHCIRCQ